jgi:hypothetical protein
MTYFDEHGEEHLMTPETAQPADTAAQPGEDLDYEDEPQQGEQQQPEQDDELAMQQDELLQPPPVDQEVQQPQGDQQVPAAGLVNIGAGSCKLLVYTAGIEFPVLDRPTQFADAAFTQHLAGQQLKQQAASLIRAAKKFPNQYAPGNQRPTAKAALSYLQEHCSSAALAGSALFTEAQEEQLYSPYSSFFKRRIYFCLIHGIGKHSTHNCEETTTLLAEFPGNTDRDYDGIWAKAIFNPFALQRRVGRRNTQWQERDQQAEPAPAVPHSTTAATAAAPKRAGPPLVSKHKRLQPAAAGPSASAAAAAAATVNNAAAQQQQQPQTVSVPQQSLLPVQQQQLLLTPSGIPVMAYAPAGTPAAVPAVAPAPAPAPAASDLEMIRLLLQHSSSENQTYCKALDEKSNEISRISSELSAKRALCQQKEQRLQESLADAAQARRQLSASLDQQAALEKSARMKELHLQHNVDYWQRKYEAIYKDYVKYRRLLQSCTCAASRKEAANEAPAKSAGGDP